MITGKNHLFNTSISSFTYNSERRKSGYRNKISGYLLGRMTNKGHKGGFQGRRNVIFWSEYWLHGCIYYILQKYIKLYT